MLEIEKINEKILIFNDLKKGKQNYYQYLCELSNLLESFKSIKEKKEIIKRGLHIIIIEKVFSEENFIKSLQNTINGDNDFRNTKNYRKLSKQEIVYGKIKINFEDKQILLLEIYVSFIILASIFDEMTIEDVAIFRNKLGLIIKNIQKHQKGNLTLSDICFQLYEIINIADKLKYNQRFTLIFDAKFMFQQILIAKYIAGSIFLIVPQNNIFQLSLRSIAKRLNDIKPFSAPYALNTLHNIAFKIDGGIEYFCKRYKDHHENNKLNDFLSVFQTQDEKNIRYLFLITTTGFNFKKDGYFHKSIIEKINASSEEKNKIKKYAEKNLKAFNNKLDNLDSEWSNKIYLLTYKTESVFEELKNAVDEGWKVKVVIRELTIWIDEIYKIMNKYDIEDDWDKIVGLLKQENSKIEWKSTFFTPTQEEFINREVEKRKKKEVLLSIVSAMLGMINTEGGTIIVGLVENPEKILRKEIKESLIIKNDKTFFNVDYELEKYNYDLDTVKRMIQDELYNVTLLTADKFNNIWNIEPLEIKLYDRMAVIYIIKVIKANFLIYNVQKIQGSIWTTLTKRADGKTIKVDPREYFNK